MLLNLFHHETERQNPDRLLYRFGKATFRHKLGRINKDFKGEFQTIKKRLSQADGAEPYRAETIFKEVPPADGIFAVLPRGSGNTYLFKLPMIYRSGITVVIGPLQSLIRDSSTRLVMNHRYHSSIFFGAGREEEDYKILYTDIKLGKLRLVYIPPESLKVKRIMEELNHITGRSRINTLIIDDAHRISEWGRDFHPTYLRLPGFIHTLQKSNPEMTVLALTAYSDPLVKRDVLRTLEIREGNVELSPLYRSNLSIQAAIANGYGEKMKAYERIISKDIPKALDKESLHEVLQQGDGPVFGDDDILYQYQSETQKIDPQVKIETENVGKNTPFVIHVSMMESIENWYKDAGQAGRNGARAHCVQIVDTPADACETDMRQNRTFIPRCTESGCPYGREDLCHYGERHLYSAGTGSNPVLETINTLRIMDLLIESLEKGDSPLRIEVTDETELQVEKALFELQTLGMIDTFVLDYKKEETIFEATGFTGSFSADQLKDRLLDFLIHHDISSGQKYSRLRSSGAYDISGLLCETREVFGDDFSKGLRDAIDEGSISRFESNEALFNETGVHLIYRFQHVHEKRLEKEYRMIWNLKEFMKNPDCRYATLLKHFHAVAEQWKCGACDNCKPSLNFDKPKGHTVSESIIELERAYEEWLEKFDTVFDFDVALQFREKFKDYPLNTYFRSVSLLEKSAGNIKAMFMAREFSPAGELIKHAVDLIREANRDLDFKTVIRLYDTSPEDQEVREAQFDILDDEYGAFNTEEGEQWLCEEAAALGLDDSRTRILSSRRFINRLKQINLSESRDKLHQLVKEL